MRMMQCSVSNDTNIPFWISEKSNSNSVGFMKSIRLEENGTHLWNCGFLSH